VDLSEDQSDGAHAHDRGDDRGATAVEYALLITLIAAVIFGAVAAFGTQVVALFQAATTGW